MRILLQRCDRAAVAVGGSTVGSIGFGLALFIGLAQGDDESTLKLMADKVVNLRIFSDDNDKFMFSLLDVKGAILAIPQFTLFADMHKGRRPEFFGALAPSLACPMFDEFTKMLLNRGAVQVERGIFGADMRVMVENNGPVSILMDSKDFKVAG